MEGIQIFPFLQNLNQPLSPKGVKADFLKVLLSLLEGLNQNITEQGKEVDILNLFNSDKGFNQSNIKSKEVKEKPNVNNKTLDVFQPIFPINLNSFLEEKNIQINKNGNSLSEGTIKVEKNTEFGRHDVNFTVKLKEEGFIKFKNLSDKVKLINDKLEVFTNFKEIKETIPKVRNLKTSVKNVLNKNDTIAEKNFYGLQDKHDFIPIKKLIKDIPTPEKVFLNVSAKYAENSRKRKDNQKIWENLATVVEIKEFPKEKVEIKKGEIKKVVKDFKVFDGEHIKKVKVEIKDIGVEMRFLKENATLFLKLKDFNHAFITNYDALRISQIFQSAGFRLESLNVNGSEVYKDREKERERCNIGVNEPDENTYNTSSSNFSILL